MLHHRRRALLALQVRQARRLLHGRSVGAVAAPRPAGAERRHRDHDQRRVDRMQRVPPQAELRQHGGGVVLDHHVGHRDQPLHQLDAARRGEIERDAELVAVDHVEGRRLLVDVERAALGCGVPTAPPIEVAARLDLDHFGAEVGEVARGERARPTHGEIDDAGAVEEVRPARGSGGREHRRSRRRGRARRRGRLQPLALPCLHRELGHAAA